MKQISIWCIEGDGSRTLVRDDVSDPEHAKRLIEQGNDGARRRGLPHRYTSEPEWAPNNTAPEDTL